MLSVYESIEQSYVSVGNGNHSSHIIAQQVMQTCNNIGTYIHTLLLPNRHVPWKNKDPQEQEPMAEQLDMIQDPRDLMKNKILGQRIAGSHEKKQLERSEGP